MTNDMTTPLLIIAIVFDYFGVPLAIRDNKSRKREKILACQFSMYFLREYTQLSLSNVGKLFLKDHATVLHSCQKVQFESEHYADTLRDLRSLIPKVMDGITPDDYRYSQYDTDLV